MDARQNRPHPAAPKPPVALRSERWPKRAQRLIGASHVLCVEGLQEPLRHGLGHAEQQLFAMAERARQPAEQQDCMVSRQRLLQDRAGFAQRFLDELTTAFNQLDQTEATPTAAVEPGQWHALELVDPVEQEVTITLDQLGARGEARHSAALHELGYRMAVLIGAPPLEGQALPFGPHALVQAFHRAHLKLALPLEHHILLLHSFDQRVIQTLAPLYNLINSQLQAAHILPRLRSTVLPRRASKRPRPSAAEHAERTEAGAETAPGNNPSPPAASDSIEVLESLRDLLAQQRTRQNTAPGDPGNRAASADELQTALAALQQHLAEVTDHASRELRSAARLREELLTQLNANNPYGAPRTELSGEQGDTVELVAMLFEQLGQQLQRGSNAHALLGELQLPMLRVAVADHDFFDKREHPARQLLDTVASAANDWLDGSDGESDRPLAAKLDQLVRRANQETPSAGLYTSLLADIRHHLDLLTRKAETTERRHVEAAQGRERLDQARRRAAELMTERFAASPPRGLLRALLDRAWSDALALTLLRHGEISDAFNHQLAITDQLLGRRPVDDRQLLQQEVAAGLEQIGMHVEEATQVAQRLLGASEPDPALVLPSATDLALRLKQHRRLGGTATLPPPTPAEPVAAPTPVIDPRTHGIEQELRALPFGSWFEFVDPVSGQLNRRKLAWYSPMSGHCLLVTRRGQRGEEMTLTQLAQAVAGGQACIVPTPRGSLLDRAWRGLSGSLRRPATTLRPLRAEAQPR